MTTFLSRQSGNTRINESITDQTINAADAYVAGSALSLSHDQLQPRMSMRWRLWMSKTGAGTATPNVILRVGTAGSVADTARATFTGPAQTADADTANLEVTAIVRVAGSGTILAVSCKLIHDLQTTGFAVRPAFVNQITTGAFDTSTGNHVFGLSLNPGASGVWTVVGCIADAQLT